MQLRPAVKADIQALTDLWHQGWLAGHAGIVPEGLTRYRNRADFHQRIMDSLSACFVIGPVGAPEGFVRIIGEEVDQFYVAPDRIGQGDARPLMDAAEDLLRKCGVVRAFLYCSVGNARAACFYRKVGWQDMGQRTVGVETRDGPFEMQIIRFEKTL